MKKHRPSVFSNVTHKEAILDSQVKPSVYRSSLTVNLIIKEDTFGD
jgi:hypothetical protein